MPKKNAKKSGKKLLSGQALRTVKSLKLAANDNEVVLS